MKRIQLGQVTYVSNPDMSNQSKSGATEKTFEVVERKVSLTDAQRAAGFPIYQPTFLPSPALQLVQVYQSVLVTSNSEQTIGVTLKYRQAPTQWLVVEQRVAKGFSEIETPYDIREGLVQGRPAVLFGFDISAQGESSGRLTLLTCVFEQGDFLFEIHGPHLTTEVAVRVAESLR